MFVAAATSRNLRARVEIAQSRKGRIYLVILVSLSFFLSAASPTRTPIAQAMVSPSAPSGGHTRLALDGTAASACDHTTNSCSAVLSTSRNNDILIAYTFEDLNLQTSPCTFSVSDGAALSWASRSGIVFGNGGLDQLQEFWAESSAVLSSDTITESISGCASAQFGGEYNGLMVFGVSGADFNNPFDPDTSMPGTGSSYGSTTSVTISTSRHNDMIIGGSRLTSQSPGAGFTLIISTDAFMTDSTEYKVVKQPVTSLPVTFTSTITTYWEAIADALQS